ncbi:hypothetical protein GGTG_11871 [Gaeumannomyces tritici R3-111a-1]|uniref:Uncharacterized protein n=1 Tax=Gaeumannomyces tritici (strain R3-111a-1) TaxID=644352 RepID=J3PEE0_GAET3|nr:hypothetical protein GGTG_11871 [Gaeumannomyces tritici R3-111a-1]EJT70848.1 hypothetical protein GGTG_11871 [Gaeumannomyces tritici R3-111a-1]
MDACGLPFLLSWHSGCVVGRRPADRWVRRLPTAHGPPTSRTSRVPSRAEGHGNMAGRGVEGPLGLAPKPPNDRGGYGPGRVMVRVYSDRRGQVRGVNLRGVNRRLPEQHGARRAVFPSWPNEVTLNADSKQPSDVASCPSKPPIEGLWGGRGPAAWLGCVPGVSSLVPRDPSSKIVICRNLPARAWVQTWWGVSVVCARLLSRVSTRARTVARLARTVRKTSSGRAARAVVAVASKGGRAGLGVAHTPLPFSHMAGSTDRREPSGVLACLANPWTDSRTQPYWVRPRDREEGSQKIWHRRATLQISTQSGTSSKRPPWIFYTAAVVENRTICQGNTWQVGGQVGGTMVAGGRWNIHDGER